MKPNQWLAPVLHRRIGPLPLVDVAAAAFLSAYVVLITCGIDNPNPHAGPLAAVVATSLTIPVAYRRPAPVAAAATLAVAAVVNALLIGDLVRCGAALPAAFCVAYTLGVGPTDPVRRHWVRSLIGMACVATNVFVQCVSDPQLGLEVALYMVPIAFLFFGLGGLVRSWTRALEMLRRSTSRLEEQRAETAWRAVSADRAALTAELESTLISEVDAVVSLARSGVEADADLTGAGDRLVELEERGRAILQEMRRLVLGLDSPMPTEPQPTLAQLPRLVDQTCGPAGRLSFEGAVRPLATPIELCGYRIVEQLLAATDQEHSAATVQVRFGAERLEIEVAGTAPRADGGVASVAAVRERVALYGGSLDASGESFGWVAHLPLVTSDG